MGINVRIRDGMCPDPTTGDGGATEGDIRGSFSDIIDVIGVKDLAGGHCAVTQNSPAAMSVLVAPGIVYIPNADYDELDSNQVRFWEAIVTVSTAVTITANTSGSARVDLICAKMDTTVIPDEHASNIATLVAVAGTPGAGTPATPDNHYVLATVAVANGASTIVNANITSTRVQSKIDFDFLPKATGAEINTGTSDVTIVTPKAIADSYLSNGYNSMARQAIINGNFDVWQRGTSFTINANNGYTADRWKMDTGAGGAVVITQQAFALGQTDVPNEPKYFIRIAMGTGGSSPTFDQWIEGVRTLAGKTVTLSFYAKVSSGTLSVTPNLLQYFGSGGSPSGTVTVTGGAKTITTTLTKYTATYTLGSLSGKSLGTDGKDSLILRFALPSNATFTLDIAQVQLCAGDVALPFMPKSYEEELRACRRYCRQYDGAVDVLPTANQTTTAALSALTFETPMRGAWTVETSTVTGSAFSIICNNNAFNISTISYANVTANGGLITYSMATSTAGSSGILRIAAGNYLRLVSEL